MLRWVDPDGGGYVGWCGWLVDEALWIGGKGAIEGELAGGMDVVGLAVMHLVRGHQSETGMVVVVVVPGEDLPTELLGIFDAAEAAGKAWLVVDFR